MDLTQGDIRGHLKHLALPSSIAFLFATMLYIVDTYFAGTISTSAQAALSISFPIYFVIIAFIQGVSVGSQALISNALGSGKKALFLSCQAISFGVAAGFLLTVLGALFARTMLSWIGAVGDVHKYAALYLEYTFFFSIFMILINTFNAVLMSYGLAKPFRNWLITAFLIHLIGDPWLIYGGLGVPPLGFDGIVYTTVITVTIGSVFMGSFLVKHRLLEGCRASDFIPRKKEFGALIQQGLPACMNMMSMAFGLLLIMGFILYFGEKAAAAYGIAIRVQQLFFLPMLGISIATLAIIGQNNGAGRIDRIKECLRQTFYIGFIVMSIGFIPMMGVPAYLMSLFTKDPAVIEIGVPFLRISSITCFAFMAITFFTSALQGMKYPLSAFAIGFLRQVILPLIILPLLFAFFPVTLTAIWVMVLVINGIFAVVAYYLLQRAIKIREKEVLESS